MWPPPVVNHGDRMASMIRLVAVAIDRDKSSQIALKWAVDNLLSKGQTVVLIHVRQRQSMLGLSTSLSLPVPRPDAGEEIGDDQQLKEMFLPFRVFCRRKDIQCYDVVLDDTDISRAIIDYVKQSAIDVLVLGATAKGSIFRFKVKDIPGSVVKGVPDFCTFYVINKGNISSTRAASRPTPSIISPLRNQIMMQVCSKSNGFDAPVPSRSSFFGQSRQPSPCTRQNDANYIKSPFTHWTARNGKSYAIPSISRSPMANIFSTPFRSSPLVDVFVFVMCVTVVFVCLLGFFKLRRWG